MLWPPRPTSAWPDYPDCTPLLWRGVHLTVLTVGLTEDITPAQTQTMITETTRLLADQPPIPLTLHRVFYHPETIIIPAQPATALNPLLHAARTATRTATGHHGVVDHQPWTPHITLAYSTTTQPAAPVTTALGTHLTPRETTLTRLHLVNQDGPEHHGNWHPLATIPLGPH